MQDILTTCEKAARSAGQILLDMQGRIEAKEKAPSDLVTEADITSQREIESYLRRSFPEFGFVGEEEQAGKHITTSGDWHWIVDPLDGTTNYVHGLDNYAVSIALHGDGRLQLGVVFDPVRDELYSAISGEGADLNGKRLATSDVTELNQALLAASFSARVERDSPEISRFIELLCQCQALRRLGSAALNLCYVAAGRLDGYWATSVKKWDVAAGILIISEAGGFISALDGGPIDLESPRLVTAASKSLHEQLFEALSLVAE